MLIWTKSHPTMTSPPKSFTKEGLPLDRFGTPPSTNTDDGDCGPSRRISDCRPPQMVHSSITRPSSKRPLISESLPLRAGKSLKAGPCDCSLIDDDEDVLIDYFGTSASSPAATPLSQASASSSHWNLREQDVPALPSFYPLEKSAVFIPHASAPAVASRIADALQSRSIKSSFDAQHAKVDCVSESNVEFRIRLYRPRGEDLGHGLIVEVQRRFGFDVSYMQDVFAILDSAKGKESLEQNRTVALSLV